MRSPLAPCGCDWNSKKIYRNLGVRFPTAFVNCRCSLHNATWTERYEFDFSVPLGGKTNEQAEEDYKKEEGR